MREIEELIYELFSSETSTNEIAEWKEEITQYVRDSIGLLQRSGLSEQEAYLIAKHRLLDSQVADEFRAYQKDMAQHLRERQTLTNLLLIGCSTGGPTALDKVLTQLPKDFPAAVVVVQHMPQGEYMQTFVNFMAKKTSFIVKLARDGEQVMDGCIYMAPSGWSTKIVKRNQQYYFSLTQEKNETHSEFDALLFSLSSIENSVPLYVAVLTGMGRDGLLGLQHLKTHHPKTVVFAEHENSAVIYDMSKQIITHHLADFIADLSTIVHLLRSSIQRYTNQQRSLSIVVASNSFFYRVLLRKTLTDYYPNVTIRSVATAEQIRSLENEYVFNFVVTDFTELTAIRTPVLYLTPYTNQSDYQKMNEKLQLLSF